MKNNEKKTPKVNKNEYILSSDAEAILYGLILILLSVIGLLNNGIVGEAFTYVFSYVFGVFYVLVYALIIALGVYLIVKKELYKLKIDVKVLGGILIILAFCISSSFDETLTVSNFFSEFQNKVSEAQNYIFSMKSEAAIFNNLGGGFIGALFVGLLNTAIQPSGTMIVVLGFLILGVILLFADFFVWLFNLIVNFHNNREQIRKEAHEEKMLKEEQISKDKIETVVKEEKKDDEINVIEQVEIKRQNPSDLIIALTKDEEEDEEVDEIVINRAEVKVEQSIDDEDNLKPIEEVISDLMPNKLVNEEIEIKDDALEEETLKQSAPSEELFKEKNEYVYPSLNLLKDHFNVDENERKHLLAKEKMDKINECFKDFNIGASVISYTIGPCVTRFDVKCNTNVRINVLSSIENDLAVRLGGNKTVRLETIVEGKDTSGIEVGNEICDTVSFKECMKALEKNKDDRLLFPIGKNITGDVISGCLDDMPHLLVSGTTGSGKSVFIHNIIASLIMRNRPDELKLLLIDPKKLEFNRYNDLPHLLCPVVTQNEHAKVALMKLVEEMERRYDLFALKGRGCANYDEYIETCDELGNEKIPYIVVIIDEFADLLSENEKEIMKLVQRIAQKARASGIHMVVATQRPSVKTITGDIKANIPSRIALSVSSQTDSRVIIDECGAENLLGRGDLLARIPYFKNLIRVQSAFIESKEIYAICEHIKAQSKFVCDKNFEDLTIKVQTPFASVEPVDYSISKKDYHNDPLYEQVKKFVIATGKCSTAKLMNQFSIGYLKADGFLETLEKDNVIKKEGNKRVVNENYVESEVDE